MNGNIFETVPLIKPSFLQSILHQIPQENAVIALNNLLATKAIIDISPEEINAIQQRYQLNLLKEFQLNLEEFYAVYLHHCLSDKVLSSDEMEALKHLKGLLNLKDAFVDMLHAKMGAIVYQATFMQAVADGRLTEPEKQFLLKLENDLKLPQQIVEKISSEVKNNFIQNYIAGIITDQRLSPDEEEELEKIAGSLEIPLNFDAPTLEQLQKLKLYWALENLELLTIEPGILLQRGEKCYLKISNVKWHELRSTRQKVGTASYSATFRVAKGFYLRTGNNKQLHYTSQQMKLIDTGTVYLTSKRILFSGLQKNTTLQLGKIIELKPYTDGAEIGKETGKNPTLQMQEHADVFCLILERLLRER